MEGTYQAGKPRNDVPDDYRVKNIVTVRRGRRSEPSRLSIVNREPKYKRESTASTARVDSATVNVGWEGSEGVGVDARERKRDSTSRVNSLARKLR